MSKEEKNDIVRGIAAGNGGLLRMRDALQAGVDRATFYNMRDDGLLVQECRGLYRHSDWDLHAEPELAFVALKFPKAVVSLISALSFHDITTQIPHRVNLFIPKNAELPRLDWPVIDAHRISDNVYEAGIETHTIEGVDIRVYGLEKTIADCFKFRNKIGFDICLEALKMAHAAKRLEFSKLFEYARICRVFNVILPYTEVLV